MSKTKGNVIDPLDVIHGATLEQLLERTEEIADAKQREDAQKTTRKLFGKGIPGMGADALRFSLAALNVAGRMRLSIERVEGYRNFINKLWNASRFALMNLDGYDPERFEAQLAQGPKSDLFTLADRWILSRLARVSAEVDAALDGFRFSDAANAIYHFVWHELCDWYIEMAKPTLHVSGADLDPRREPRRHVVQGVLATSLETTLRLLHPFAPFVTEEIWQKLPKPSMAPASLMVTVFPGKDLRMVDEDAEGRMALLQEVTVAIRMLRGTYNVPPSWSVPVELHASDEARRTIIERHRDVIENGARVTLTVAASGPRGPQSAKAVVGADVEILMPLAGLIDIGAEKARITKEIAKAEKEIGGLERKLANADFVAKAPEEVVAEQRTRLTDEQARRSRLVDALAQLG
jgi:valyl-tRNA synthetase